MRWRYGIIKNTFVRGNKEWTNYYIGEVYYGDNPNKPSMCSDEGYFPVFEEDNKDQQAIKEEIKKELLRMLKDIEGNDIIDSRGPFEDGLGRKKLIGV
jgi:hypothetical protein